MNQRRRKRGIRASREKLESAMLKRGITTQSELANRIAEIEGLEKAPKDLVNKVFREQAVSTHNLTRVANALGVDAHTVYLSSSDQTFDDVAQEQTASKSDTQKQTQLPKHFILVSMLVVASVVVVFLVFNQEAQESLVVERISSPLGKLLIIVQSDDINNDIADAMVTAYRNRRDISVEKTSLPDAYSLRPDELLQQWQAHMVLRLERLEGKYYQLLSVKAVTEAHDEYILQIIARDSELAAGQNKLLSMLQREVDNFIEGKPLVPPVANTQDQLKQLISIKDDLFEAHSPDHFVEIEANAQSLLADNPNSAPILLAFCELNVRKSWSDSETQSLENAAKACHQASKVAQSRHLYVPTHAELISQTANVDDALQFIHSQLDSFISNADAYALMADLYLKLYSGQQGEVENIESFAYKAIEFEPFHWRAFNTLGNLYFRTGQIEKAKQQFYEASQIVKQSVILSNLGAMQMCFDELQQAENTYLTMIKEQPEYYLAYENLGTVYFFQREYESALTQKLKAIELNPEIAIHQVWSSIAELYLRVENVEEAIKYYAKAMSILERDKLLENIGKESFLYEIYYQTKINLLSGQTSHLEVASSETLRQLQENLNLYGLREKTHYAWLLEQFDLENEKQSITTEITSVCPVYQHVL